jgi:cation diffusion facilitator family transporter
MPADPNTRLSSAQTSRLTRQVALLSVGVASVLIALKAVAWLASGSVAVLASLVDSLLDLVASAFTYFAVRYAGAPPDREHRFGHGKAEAFAGLFQAGLVAVSAALVAAEAISRLWRPEPIAAGEIAIWVLIVSMVCTAGLVFAQTRAIAQTNSVATKGDRAHYAADFASNAVAMLGVAGAMVLGWTQLDALAGLAVAAWLAWGAWTVAREAGDHLMDRELPDADRARIAALALADPAVKGVHDLRTRSSGPILHIQFHADLDGGQTLKAAHAVIVAAEDRIRAHYPAADVIIHADPLESAEPHGHELFEPRRPAHEAAHEAAGKASGEGT